MEYPIWRVVRAVGSLQEVMRWDAEDIDAYLGLLDRDDTQRAASNAHSMKDLPKNGSG